MLASCGGGGGDGGAALPDLTTGEAIPMDALIAAAKAEGELTTSSPLPHDWANYGESIETFKTKYGIKINELNPDAGSADEIEAIRANKDNKGPQAPDTVDVGIGYGPTGQGTMACSPSTSSPPGTPSPLKDPDGYWFG